MFNPTSPIPQWLADLQRRKMVDANEAALQFWGMTREQFLNNDFDKFFHPDEMPRWEVFIEADQWGESGPWKCTRGDGTMFYCTTRWQMIDHNGRPCAFVFAVRAGGSPETMVELLHSNQLRATGRP
ncbi:MAG: PAS domain-containing protein [Candidatus Korobacteraceae bacterium]